MGNNQSSLRNDDLLILEIPETRRRTSFTTLGLKEKDELQNNFPVTIKKSKEARATSLSIGNYPRPRNASHEPDTESELKHH